MRSRYLFCPAWLLFTCTVASGSIVSFQSGNGLPGEPDALVRYTSFGNFLANVPSEADFAASRNGDVATVFPDNTNGCQPLASFPDALPVFNAIGQSSLFAIPLFVPDPQIASARLQFEFISDNYLGGPDVAAQGLYLNGIALSGDTRFFDPDGQPVFFEGTIIRNDIAPLLLPNATNWLYLNITDVQPRAGVLFGGVIHTNAVPEPSTCTMFAVGVGLIALLRRRRCEE